MSEYSRIQKEIELHQENIERLNAKLQKCAPCFFRFEIIQYVPYDKDGFPSNKILASPEAFEIEESEIPKILKMIRSFGISEDEK